MREYFDCCVKRPFCYSDTGEVSVKLLGVDDNPNWGVLDQRITIDWWVASDQRLLEVLLLFRPNLPIPRTDLRSLFDPVCNQVVRLVKDQILKVESQRHKVKV